jgi:hypothetical protein
LILIYLLLYNFDSWHVGADARPVLLGTGDVLVEFPCHDDIFKRRMKDERSKLPVTANVQAFFRDAADGFLGKWGGSGLGLGFLFLFIGYERG